MNKKIILTPIKKIFKWGFILFCFLLFYFSVIAYFTWKEVQHPKYNPGTFLLLDLDNGISNIDYEPSPLENILNQIGLSNIDNQTSTFTIERVLSQASKDPKIQGLLIRGNLGAMNEGWASVLELKNGLEHFKSKHKPVRGYAENLSLKDLFIYSFCDELFMNELGVIDLSGLMVETPYLSEFFDNLGINFQVIKTGRYKSAVEPFITNQISSENLWQNQNLLSIFWSYILRELSSNLSLSTTQLQDLSNTDALIFSNQAKDLNIVKDIYSKPEYRNYIKSLSSEEETPLITIKGYSKLFTNPKDKFKRKFHIPTSSRDIVAILPITGGIYSGESTESNTGSETVTHQLRSLKEDENVRAIILRVDSPGGSATASDEILEEILEVQKVKDVYVSMGDYAASGGYWVSTTAKEISASPLTITGSIGVFGLLPNFEGLSGKLDIYWERIGTSELSSINSVITPKREKELYKLQNYVENIYAIFLSNTARYRNLDNSYVEEIAQGIVWPGQDALQLGLIDNYNTPYQIFLSIQEEHDTNLEPVFVTSSSNTLPLLSGSMNSVTSLIPNAFTQFLPLFKDLENTTVYSIEYTTIN